MKFLTKKMEFLVMKKVFALPVLLVAVLFLAGCAIFETDNNYLRPEDFASQLRKDGIQVDSIRPLRPEPLSATAAVELKIGPSNIGVYKYDTNIRVQKARLERIKKNKRVYFNGIPYPVYEVSGSFIIVGLDKHKDKMRILESFRNFK